MTCLDRLLVTGGCPDDGGAGGGSPSLIDEIVREGARRMLAEALHAALAMAFKLIESAQRRWRMVNAPHLVALVRADAVFVNGKLVERPEEPGLRCEHPATSRRRGGGAEAA